MTVLSPKEIARERVAALLDEFDEFWRAGHLDRQSEATSRTWIERFLVAMGWDPGDPREIVQERRIVGRDARLRAKDEAVHDRPDYALLVQRRPVAYLEAKPFEVDFDDDLRVFFQVRSYGWSKGLRASYAFNLEQFAVWDTRFEYTVHDTPGTARIVWLKRSEYLENFDTLWDYLGHEAVLRGSILRRHPENRRTPDMRTFDVAFEDRLTEWRIGIAQAILRHGKEHHPDIAKQPEIVSSATQRILDRIVFLRFCEQMGLEDYGSLSSMASGEHGFWHDFMHEHDRYRRVYDGILFPASNEQDPIGVEAYINDWWLKGEVFKRIGVDLYAPGYRFEAVPLELLGGIYERFLGKRLVISGASVKDEYKPEYQQTKGAVYTPEWVVQRILDRVLGPLAENLDPGGLLSLKILDPACGSGSFLLGTFDWMEHRILDWFRAHPEDTRFRELVRPSGSDLRLTGAATRRLVDDCLFGVDIDTEAVEVARMSLALRFLERAAPELEDEPRDLLKGIGRNVKQGNSLVGIDCYGLGFDPAAVARVRAFDWWNPNSGFGTVLSAGGFDAIVGNPPYIEVKRYREWLPDQYRYFKSKPPPYETAAEGKTDISIPFMERGAKLLRPGGRLGFIIQNRFFKTDYGEAVRRWLRRDGLLEDIEDFHDLQIFSGRTTYTAIVTLSRRANESFAYRTYDDINAARQARPRLEIRCEHRAIDDGVWAFDQPDLLALHRSLAQRHGTIGAQRQLSIGVGLQTLWGKAYTLRAVTVGKRIVKAIGLDGQERPFERAILRPLCRNDGFYPFRQDNADGWVIFPYEVHGDEFREIGWREMEKRFPQAAEYLQFHRKAIRKAVEVNPERDRWHLYTRPQNIASQAKPKVLFPMTIEDVMATADPDGVFYQDNVNVNALFVNGSGIDLRACAAIFNSSLFNALAKLKAGLNDSGWRKFNRQFADLVPFPLARLTGDRSAHLSSLSTKISDVQDAYVHTEGEGERQALHSLLESLWRELDEAVEALYGLTLEEQAVARRHPRRQDRIALLTRQVRPEEDDGPPQPE